MRAALLSAITLLFLTRSAAAQPGEFRSFVEDYAQALLRRSPADVRAFWWPEDLEHSERLGIRYDGHGPKIDAASVLVLATDPARDVGIVLDTVDVPPENGHARLALSFEGGAGGSRTIYHGWRAEGRWWLRHPLRLALEGWTRGESEYLRLFRHPALPAHPLAVAELDAFVQRFAAEFGLGAESLDLLRRQKIDWVLGPEAEVHALIGAPAHGVANLQMDAVITQHAFHPHELAHILLNLARRVQPPAALPILQEGFAVREGGRFRSSAEMQMEFGCVLLRTGLVGLPEILSDAGFRALPADMSYPPAALFVDFLMTRLGTAAFLELYGAFTAAHPELSAWSSEEIAARFERALGLAPGRLEPEFRRHWMSRPAGALERGAVLGEEPRTRVAGGNTLRFSVADSVASIVLSNDAADSLSCAIVWPQCDASLPQGSHFAEHFEGRPYRGERFALIVEPGEVGFYDYGLDRLVAKHADGFEPDPGFWDAEDGVMRLRLDLTRLPPGFERARFRRR